ncbi:LysR family transcriptional regulator [Spirochaetia bacterium]|nr:LysR family transcriptional regulator [Spirochaetia bacterium]
MTTEQLRYFVSIAENSSYSDTAREYSISQSSVSKQIRAFEWEMGCTLFDRGHRHVKLTEIGSTLYPRMKNMLAQFDDIMNEAHGYKSSENTIKLVSLPILGQYNITKVLQLFEADRKTIQVLTVEQEEREISETIVSGDYDIVITREEILPPGAYKKYKIAEDSLALFVNENHRYAENKTISLDLIAKEPLMLMPKYTFIYHLCIRLFREQATVPNVISCARIETILSNIESSRCSSLLMAKSVNMFRSAKIKVIPIEPPCISNIVAVCPVNAEPKKATERFIRFLTAYFS